MFEILFIITEFDIIPFDTGHLALGIAILIRVTAFDACTGADFDRFVHEFVIEVRAEQGTACRTGLKGIDVSVLGLFTKEIAIWVLGFAIDCAERTVTSRIGAMSFCEPRS